MAKAKHKGVNIATHNDGIIQQDLTKHLPEYLTEHLPEYLTDSDIQNLPEDLTEHLSEDLTEYLTKDLTDADIRKWPIAYIVSRLRGKSEQEYHDNMKAAEHSPGRRCRGTPPWYESWDRDDPCGSGGMGISQWERYLRRNETRDCGGRADWNPGCLPG